MITRTILIVIHLALDSLLAVMTPLCPPPIATGLWHQKPSKLVDEATPVIGRRDVIEGCYIASRGCIAEVDQPGLGSEVFPNGCSDRLTIRPVAMPDVSIHHQLIPRDVMQHTLNRGCVD